MAIKVYGSAMSRASRVMWCAREIGIPYEHIDIAWDSLKSPDYLAINPNGKVPAMTDGNLTLFESLAINLYLAKKYGTGELYPTNIEDEARVLQWTLWAATEVEPHLLPSVLVKFGIYSDAAGAKAAAERATPALKVLEAHLASRDWIVGSKFGIADLNVSGAVAYARYGEVDISYAPHVVAWLDRCLSRPAHNQGANA
jgi:glutathione S-transferase